jgi:hypothetical protein
MREVITMRQADLPEGVTAEEVAIMLVGKQEASEALIVVINTYGVKTPDPSSIRQANDHLPSDIATTPDERGRPAIEILRSLCGKAQLDLDTDDSGNVVTTEKIGKPMRRTFKDIGEAIRIIRARVAIGADLDRQQRLEAEAAAKGEPEPVPVGRDYHAELAEMCRHYEIDCQLGPVITLAGKPFTKTFPRIEDAVEFLRKRQF